MITSHAAWWQLVMLTRRQRLKWVLGRIGDALVQWADADAADAVCSFAGLLAHARRRAERSPPADALHAHLPALSVIVTPVTARVGAGHGTVRCAATRWPRGTGVVETGEQVVEQQPAVSGSVVEATLETGGGRTGWIIDAGQDTKAAGA